MQHNFSLSDSVIVMGLTCPFKLNIWSSHDIGLIRYYVAKNIHTSLETLKLLSMDDISYVKVGAIMHPNFPVELRDKYMLEN